jgi:hypothetical protein
MLLGLIGEFPNPNPNFQVPEMSVLDNLGRKSGVKSEYPNFGKPEKPDPKFWVYPNAQRDLHLHLVLPA